MRDKTVRAVFGASMATKTDAVWQYDYGLMLKLAGLELPESYEVYFGTAFRGADALRMIGNAEGVDIPDELLTLGKTIYAWLFLHSGEDDGETVAMVTIPVNVRAKGSDVEPTPVQQDVITQAIAALNDGVETVQEIADGIPDTIDAALTEAKESGEFDGPPGPQGERGEKGDRGETGAQGPKGETGATGAPGQDGVSPTVTITEITGGHRITITDATGSHSADVMDGEGAVQDVQVNGTSVVVDGVANVPAGGNGVMGVYKLGANTNGLEIVNDQLRIIGANDPQIKDPASNVLRPITPSQQHKSAFYGLAKAAGDTTQRASANAVGTYTESAKSAISEMLNGSVSVNGTTPTINALPGVRYVCGEVSTIDIVTPETGIVDVVFKSGSAPAVLTVTPPSGMTMQWAAGFDPSSLEADTTYEINVMDGCLGVAGTWS